MSIPALDRGLTVIEALIDNPGGLRFSELKRLLTGITDATLNRLLNSLTESGHIVRSDSGYTLSDRVPGWVRMLSKRESLAEQAERAVDQIVETLGESAGFCLLEEGRILMMASRSCPDSISILPASGMIHFEEDHAAALAVLSLLEPADRKTCLTSPHSLFDSGERGLEKLFQDSLEKFSRGGIIADESFRRIGISRIALPLSVEGSPSALFICLPSAAVEEKLSAAVQSLGFWKDRLEKS